MKRQHAMTVPLAPAPLAGTRVPVVCHCENHCGGATLARDTVEPSYHMDCGSAAAKYVEACMNTLNLAAASNNPAALQGA
jgi:hypothetical protein